MNRPTAIFFATAHMLYDDRDAVGAAYDLVRSNGFYGYGRERKWDAISRVAPDLADALRAVGCDIKYVNAEPDPGQAYRAVVKEVSRWLDPENKFSTEKPPGGWRTAIRPVVTQLQEAGQ